MVQCWPQKTLWPSRGLFSTYIPRRSHENPLASFCQLPGLRNTKAYNSRHQGLPRSGAPPVLPRAQRGLPVRKRIPHVKKVLVVASGKGGVGKSTVSVNLAAAMRNFRGTSRRVGLLDLDIFGPSIPKLMGLDAAGEPELTSENRLVPLYNYGIPCMSMAFLLPPAAQTDTPVVWRGMMVMKAVQQLLFDVDWRQRTGKDGNEDLDLLVIDLPPGTGDVQLSLGQLVSADGAVIVSTPQDVALIDVRKGVAMFNKIQIPLSGSVLNMSHFVCPSCEVKHPLFGPPDPFVKASEQLGLQVLGQIPLESDTAAKADQGRPIVLDSSTTGQARSVFLHIADQLWRNLECT